MGRWKETVGQGFGTGRNKGATKRTDVIDDRDGTVAGHHVEHWDDHRDAVAQPKGVTLKIKQGD